MNRGQTLTRPDAPHDYHLAVWLLYALFAAVFLLLASNAAGAAPSSASVTVNADLTTQNVRSEECNLADVIVDAIRALEKSDIAFMPASGFKDFTIPHGQATAADFLNALMYPDDSISIVKLTGAQVKKALEQSLSLTPQKNSAFLQVSGITVNIDPNGGKDNRVTSVKVGKLPLDNAKTYMVAMPSPLANGALAYFKVWSKTDIDHTTDNDMGKAINAYLLAHTILSGKGDDRLVFKK
jgi:2',3'-cyclic-nucleotide 2'-phosphodiesterase (5'-nucleotidase family)